MANRPAPGLVLREGDLEVLESWLRATTVPAGLARRARIVLLAAQGVANSRIAQAVGVSVPTVVSWRRRYQAGGVRGLEDAPRSGRPRQVPRERVVAATLAPPPKRYGVTHWSSRLLARHLGIGNATVARVWRSYGIQPWRSGTFKYSTDPELVAKVTDVVGLYLAPPDNAVVLCVDEKSQIQALDRTAPMLPMAPGRIGAAHPRLHPARHLHPVRRPGGRRRPRHSRLQAPPPPYRAARLPAPGHARLPRRRAAPGDGQLRNPQDPRGARLAGGQPSRPRPLHPHQRLLAQHGRDLLLRHRPCGHPPRSLHLRQGPQHQDPRLHQQLEPALPPIHLDQDPRRDPHQIPTKNKLTTQDTSAWPILRGWRGGAYPCCLDALISGLWDGESGMV